jgi:hypothetical protein
LRTERKLSSNLGYKMNRSGWHEILILYEVWAITQLFKIKAFSPEQQYISKVLAQMNMQFLSGKACFTQKCELSSKLAMWTVILSLVKLYDASITGNKMYSHAWKHLCLNYLHRNVQNRLKPLYIFFKGPVWLTHHLVTIQTHLAYTIHWWSQSKSTIFLNLIYAFFTT